MWFLFQIAIMTLITGSNGAYHSVMTLFEPSPPDDRPPLHTKAFERERGVVFFLGAAAALVGVIYLLSFLGD
jgi:hypothetical protein